MSILAPPPAAARALRALIDYAGLFPPARLALEPALAQYAQARGGAYAWMLGRFILPASRLAELLETSGGKAPEPLSVILDAGGDARAWFGRAQSSYEAISSARERGALVEAVEIPLPALLNARDTYDALIGQCAALHERAGLRGIPAYVELAHGERADRLLGGSLAALRRYGLRAKIRCGGVEPQAFPSVAALARFVGLVAEAGIAFKATAGLHHPVRHFDRDAGVTMHGFLNLLAAAVFAGRVDDARLEALIAEEDPAAFELGAELRWRDLTADAGAVAAAREGRFVGYGSCSFEEPVNDLRALRIVPEA